MSQWISASAPSNIALIKYMGKTDAQSNLPANPSLSYTLENLRTFVRIRENPELTADSWSSFSREDLRPIELSAKGLKKFLNHFSFLKQQFGLTQFFQIESANNFPSDCGLASSASSFAALTLATHEFYIQQSSAKNKNGVSLFTATQLSAFSQKGSGSSCRSFFSPWSLWNETGAQSLELPLVQLKHQVLLCDENVKAVSSSEAHGRVLTSDMFNGRVVRATERLQNLIDSLKNNQWQKAFEICWNEFWDMHVLFHTAKPAFFYMNEKTIAALQALHNNWKVSGDGPLITMDAGSNIHLLYRQDQTQIYNSVITEFNSKMPLWTDEGYLAKI